MSTLIEELLSIARKHPKVFLGLALAQPVVMVILQLFDSTKNLVKAYCAFFLVVFITLPYLSSAIAKPKYRVLLLRKFNFEGGGKFCISIVFDLLVQRGFDVVTLRDSVVGCDRLSARPFSYLLAIFIGFFIGLAGLFLAFSLFLIGVSLVIDAAIAYKLILKEETDDLEFICMMVFCALAIFFSEFLTIG